MSSPLRPSSKSDIIGDVRSILTELPSVDSEIGFPSFPAESEKVIENGRRPSRSFSLIDLDAIQIEPVFSELDCSVSKNITITGDERPSLLINSRDILFKTVAQFVSNILSECILTLVNNGKVSSI